MFEASLYVQPFTFYIGTRSAMIPVDPPTFLVANIVGFVSCKLVSPWSVPLLPWMFWQHRSLWRLIKRESLFGGRKGVHSTNDLLKESVLELGGGHESKLCENFSLAFVQTKYYVFLGCFDRQGRADACPVLVG